MGVNSGEILFVKSVKDGIPNRDPLADSDARRIFGENDGRISLSDVSIKRDVRDYVQMAYPDGGELKNRFIYVREERDEKGKLLGRSSLADKLLERTGNAKGPIRENLIQAAFDVRSFGAVFSVKNESFKLTGPVQFGWAHSLHPVETRYVQGTVVMPSKDTKDSSGEANDEGKSQGTIWTSYILPFAVFAMPGVINASIAKEAMLEPDDVELLLEALWRGTQQRQARGRGIQQPLFLMHVEYRDPLFRIGYLEEGIRLLPDKEEWTNGQPPSSVQEISLDVSGLFDLLKQYQDKIARCRLWLNPSLQLKGDTSMMNLQPLW
ncbi:CRISPR-associated protein [Effusibacillus lacus]|uniref:CRISPR-associated protein Csh2 n=1 Tax=Effusibacillus lacus TaxID=1348429 RepID=A0A292YNC9_9BACL|nr:type I CRISPR-associated protein Cas7 [Effusibacillus lacus]TCS68779.1 CRISPR-associated Csh2 family protein [Effusibacillus lacus]GAX90696.1 CRISPR-associated protein Csh2 [Effusibacillus lacus]